jgi:hypothetical protein
MRFWITLTLGIVLISAFGSAAYVYFPEAFGYGKAESAFVRSSVSPVSSQKLPLFEYDRVRDDVDKVRQFTQGSSVFHLRNDGEGDLQLHLGSKSCSCAAIRLDKDGQTLLRFAATKEVEDLEKAQQENRRDRAADAVEGRGNVNPTGKIVLRPGEQADFVVEWDAQDFVGVKTVTGAVLSSDPRSERREVEFVVRLNVYPELIVEPSLFSFGQLRDGQERQESIAVYSLVHEDLSVEFESATSSAVTVDVRPMTEEEKTASKAKSGFIATATVKGRLPVGDYSETVVFRTNLPQQAQRRVSVSGFVNGEIEVHPGRIDFRTASQAGGAKQRVSISAPALAEGETLVLDEKRIQTEPEADVVGATLSRHEEYPQVWLAEVFIKPTKHVGPFKAWIPIADSKGQDRVTILVEGNLAAAGH